jgi:hypothetical protein
VPELPVPELPVPVGARARRRPSDDDEDDDPPPDTVSPTVPLRTVIVPENGAVSVAPASALVSCVTVDWAWSDLGVVLQDGGRVDVPLGFYRKLSLGQ